MIKKNFISQNSMDSTINFLELCPHEKVLNLQDAITIFDVISNEFFLHNLM